MTTKKLKHFALSLLAALAIAGCTQSKTEYDAQHGEGAWDRMEESEWESEKQFQHVR